MGQKIIHDNGLQLAKGGWHGLCAKGTAVKLSLSESSYETN
jgi:hypothetical protein